MNREIFLDNLPKRGKSIDWAGSIGYKVSFKYHEIEGEIEILEYDKGDLKVSCNNKIFSTTVYNLSNCALGIISGKYCHEHKFNIDDIINSNSGKLKIIEKTNTPRGTKLKNVRSYNYECLVCGNKDTISEASIINTNGGCGVCASKKVKVGFNDIWTTHPELGKFMWNRNDGHIYTSGSKKKVDWKCPNCNLKVKNKEIYSIKDQGLSCPMCSDGISFPNKFMYHVLTQANIKFENEWSPSWAKVDKQESTKLNGRKFFDFYIPSLNYVIEMHGEQHYKTSGKFARTLDLEMKNDKLKEQLLYDNGIKYVCIDSQISELEYIKNNILKSKLNEIIDFNNINWLKCDKDCLNSLLVEACDLFNDKKYSTTQICEELRMSKGTIIRYLKRGTKIGICSYDATKEAKKSRVKGNAISAEVSKKAVLQFSMDGIIIGEFESAREAAKHVNLSFSVIPAACVGKQKSAGGYRWMYKEDYINKDNVLNKYVVTKKVSPVVRMSLDGRYIDQYTSITEASNKLDIGRAGISEVCAGRQKTAGGYLWLYKKDCDLKEMSF